MAWGETNVITQRKLFCELILNKTISISEGCRQFDISRKTAYKWLQRFQEDGDIGLINQSRARLTQHQAVSQDIINSLLDIKSEWMKWGPKKICAKFKERYPSINCPGTTTTENILERYGLVKRRKKRRRLPIKPPIILPTDELNYTWCMDFKGGCITSDYHKFDPFTLTDYDSRYLIKCLKLPRNNTAYVWSILEIAFKEFGLPMIIRSDNGPPFATCAPGRLSPLSIKLVKAGVIPDWIEPGNPQQNGRHERMHLTMEQEGFHPGSTLKDQTKRLEEFQTYYNFDRPHEALQQRTPGSLFVPSNRTWNGRLQPMEYTNDFKVGRVKSCGKMSWKGKEVYISRVFAGENIGIKEEDGFNVYYGPIFLGSLVNGNELEVKRRDSRKRYKSLIKS